MIRNPQIPQIWNDIPEDVTLKRRTILATFRRLLKTYLFRKFPDYLLDIN